MSKKDNALELARERANNLVRAVEAAKSSRHSLVLVNAYAGHYAPDVSAHIARAIDAIALVEDILRHKAARP